MHHVVLPQFSIQFQWNATMHSRVTFLCSPNRTWCLLCWICYNFFLSFTLSLSYPFFPFHSHLTTVGFNSLPFNSLNILPLIQIRHATADTHAHMHTLTLPCVCTNESNEIVALNKTISVSFYAMLE